MLGAVTAVAIGHLAPHRHPGGRHGEPKAQLFEVWPVIATVTKRHERPLLVIPLIRPIDLQTRGLGMQTRQVQGLALDRLADHGAGKAVQTRPPQGIQGPAQAVVMDMRRVQRVREAHLQVIGGQCPRHAGEGLLTGKHHEDHRLDARPHADCMALVGWDQGRTCLFHGSLPEHGAHEREVIPALDLDTLRG
jgi:hypothetical protein